MPRSLLDLDRLLAIAGRPLTDAALDDLLFPSKAEVEGHEGTTLTISVTPDRLDLSTEGGLGLYLQGALEVARGIPPYRDEAAPRSEVRFEVDATVEGLRPSIAGAVVRAPGGAGLDAGLLAEAVRHQELLHATIGRNRRAASLGIYPVERVQFPVRYALEDVTSVRFVPLGGAEEVSGADFFAGHPMAELYGPLGRSGERCLTLRDAAGEILSLPPVLNSRGAGEARVGDRELLIESTGTRDRTVAESVGLMLVPFVAQGWKVAPVPAVRSGGAESGTVVGLRALDLPSATLRSLGGEGLSASVVEQRLSRSRLSGHSRPGGWRVEVPPWRPDLGTDVDLAEDVLLAEGVRPQDGLIRPSPTRGRLRPETIFRRKFATILLGLGLAAPNTPVLISEATVNRVGGAPPLKLQNPVSTEFAYLRNRLLLSHLDVLMHNTRHGYPQRFGEVAPVVVVSPGSETGAETRYHAGAMIASDSAGFADAASLVEYWLRTVDILAVREPAEVPGSIVGRTARVRVAGEPVAELGEIAPAVLNEIGVPVPVAWAELDLSALWPLLGRRDSH